MKKEQVQWIGPPKKRKDGSFKELTKKKKKRTNKTDKPG